MRRYTPGQIALHWISAGVILMLLGTGLAYSYDLAGSGAMTTHQIAGQALLVAIVLRVLLRLWRGAPPAADTHRTWERYLAKTVHIGLYLILIAFVVTGYVAASGETDSALLAPVSLAFARSDIGEALLEAHFALKWALLALLALHIAGTLKHALFDRDASLSRMMPHGSKE